MRNKRPAPPAARRTAVYVVTELHPGSLERNYYAVREAVRSLGRATVPQVARRLETERLVTWSDYYTLARWYCWKLEKLGYLRRAQPAAGAAMKETA
jgi:hypothetical protein